MPGFQSFLLPLLRAVADGGEHPLRELTPRLADDLQLSEVQRAEALPSGGSRLGSRVGWACTYLKQAGLVDRPGGWPARRPG